MLNERSTNQCSHRCQWDFCCLESRPSPDIHWIISASNAKKEKVSLLSSQLHSNCHTLLLYPIDGRIWLSKDCFEVNSQFSYFAEFDFVTQQDLGWNEKVGVIEWINHKFVLQPAKFLEWKPSRDTRKDRCRRQRLDLCIARIAPSTPIVYTPCWISCVCVTRNWRMTSIHSVSNVQFYNGIPLNIWRPLQMWD